MWLEDCVKPTVKETTYRRYREVVEQHVRCALGDLSVGEVTPLRLQRFVGDLLRRGNLVTGKGLSPNSVNGVITVLRGSLRAAQALGAAANNAAADIRRPRTAEKKVMSFSVAEQKKLEKYIRTKGKPQHFGILLCLYSGLRIGELLALTWQDVNWKENTIYVNKTYHDTPNLRNPAVHITPPKTASSCRVIPVPRQLMPFLRAQKKRSVSEYVVERGETGGRVSVRSYQRTFETLQKVLSIPRKNFHALRHTFATRALECGMDVRTLSELLGHKNVAMTLNRYVHSLTEHKRSMMNKLGKNLA